MSLIKNIQFSQDGFDLNIPSLEVLDQGTTALIGPSGSGKSTLVRILLGLEKSEGWSWILKGRDVATLSVRERNFGVVFQSLDLFPHMSAFENIFFVAECRIPTRDQQLERVTHVMNRLGISKVKDQKPHTLSGGEKQRVALARALVSQPDFLFLDEPFSSLDLANRQESRQLVKEMLLDQKIPALLISHDAEDIKDLCQKAYRIEDGKLRS